MNLQSKITELSADTTVRQIIVCTVTSKAHTKPLGIAEHEDGQAFTTRAVKNYYEAEVDKVTTDNRMKQTKRVYVRV
jgi:ribosomal protein L23